MNDVEECGLAGALAPFDGELECNALDTQALLELLNPPTTATSSAATVNAGKKRSRNASRERMRQELIYLRAKTSELEATLAQLQTSKQAVSAEVSTEHSLWRRIATRQLQERTRALKENARLKEMLEMQLQLAKSLEQAIVKRPVLVELDLTASFMADYKRPRRDSTSTSIFEFLSDMLDPILAELDGVFGANGLFTKTNEMHDARVLDGSSGDQQPGFVVEVMNVKVLPFSVDMVLSALWRTLANDYFHTNDIAYVDSVNTLTAKFTTKMAQRNGVDAVVHSYFALRKVTLEADRHVLVWACDSDYMDVQGMEDIRMYEKGWIEVSSCEANSDAVDADIGIVFSAMKTCAHVMPWVMIEDKHAVPRQRSDAASSKAPIHVGTITDLVIRSYEQDLSSIYQATENLLLEEALMIQTLEQLGPQ